LEEKQKANEECFKQGEQHIHLLKKQRTQKTEMSYADKEQLAIVDSLNDS